MVHARSSGVRLAGLAVAASLSCAAPAALTGCAAASLSPAPTANAKAPVTRTPNVIVILVDDLGWPDVSTYGLHNVETPNIDRIAKTGVAFSDGYVAASVCAVSRAGLLTGKMPQTFGFTYNINDQGDVGAGLPTDQPTLGERLKRHGYHTGIFGKWHQGSESKFYPTNRGFDEFFGFIAGEASYADPDTPGIVTTHTKVDNRKPPFEHRTGDHQMVEGPGRTVVHDEHKYLTYEITDRTIDFINRSAGDPAQPFFAYVAYNAPHWPMQVPQVWYDKFPQIKDPVRRTYVAMIAAMDAGVGKILDTLEARSLRENTLVVFLSDNGCPVQFGFCKVDHPWGWGKFTYLEGGVRVPFMMSWPARLKPQGVVHAPVSSLDIVPTILHAVAPDQQLPAGLDGEDLVATALHPPAKPRTLIWGQEPVYYARRGDYRYWVSHDWNEAHLYDLGKDPWQRADIAALAPAENKALSEKVEAWRKTLPPPRWKLHFTRPVEVGGRKTEWVY
ncbi:MAG: sulfatase-like hydrolase/transferase [Sphingomonadales bacterium]|nr:sulfatase-like hydrolase/transferase [Sphingomonadales bacterium]MDE2570424.1 sulfatase-like hydrolase/transferase [Sphingomonadales bacterium]